jgi:DNA invertase Pin-like site-specific DNA recombinase
MANPPPDEGSTKYRHNLKFGIISERIDTNTAIGVAIFSILASIAQLERDLISDRVKIGLANARAKGKLIGRKKMRDSDLIRKLLKAGMTYRQIASISKTSHGSVHQELVALRREEAAAKEKAEKEQAEKDRLAAEQKKVEDSMTSLLGGSTSDKIHVEASSAGSKVG